MISDKIGKNKDDIADIGGAADMNKAKIADNMMSLASVIGRFDNDIQPLVASNSAMIGMN